MIQLTPMAEGEYRAFYEYVIRDYAEGLVRAGNAHPDLALQVSVQQCAPVLSNELASPNQFFYLIREDAPGATHVGCLWWGIREQYGVRTAICGVWPTSCPWRRGWSFMARLRMGLHWKSGGQSMRTGQACSNMCTCTTF